MKEIHCKESDREIEIKSNEIIDSFKGWSIVGKYRTIKSLYLSLNAVIQDEGYMVIEVEKENEEEKDAIDKRTS